MAKITYTNKVALNENPEIALINKVTDDDLNEIKSVVNTNDDNVGNLTNLTTTNKTNIVAAVNEVNGGKASATDLGDISDLTTTDKTSAVNAINELNSDKAADDIILVQSTEPSSDTNILWINDGQIGTPASEITNSYSTSTGIGYSANYVNNKVEPGEWTLLANTVYYKKCGNIITVRGYSTGTVSLTQNDYKTLATLPSGLRPSMDLGFPFTRIGGTDPVGIVRIKSDGVIDIYSTTAGSYWAFTMTFVL